MAATTPSSTVAGWLIKKNEPAALAIGGKCRREKAMMLTELRWDLPPLLDDVVFAAFVVAGFTLRRFHEARSTVHCTDGIWRRYPESHRGGLQILASHGIPEGHRPVWPPWENLQRDVPNELLYPTPPPAGHSREAAGRRHAESPTLDFEFGGRLPDTTLDLVRVRQLPQQAICRRRRST